MTMDHPRMVRERKTVAAMIQIYCHGLHNTKNELCTDCNDLLAYAEQRLESCPYQENKTTCANCSTHCYKPSMRKQIKTVMRYAGPRMMYKHPLLAVKHVLDGRKKEAERK
ncbi:MAG: nitrous oxide-stimulated promoter family protein [Candidatus Hermodarchaeota archaeon]